MPLSIQLGFPDVPKSITNPNVDKKDVLDKDSPLSFLDFIKLINVSFEPDTLQNYYNIYLREWNTYNNTSEIDNNTLIVNRYRDFIKELSINYTTAEEKKFLSLIDFNDSLDLDIAIGFYGRKLKELSEFYNKKRQDVKFNITRNKSRGTVFGTERSISDLTLSYLKKNYSDGKMLFDYNSIQEKLEIEIEELYDTYTQYFNQTPELTIYDKKDLDYGYDIFLKTNAELISDIFSGMSEELRQIKEVDQLFDNKRKLTQKYITTDFYYLSTGSTVSDFISGKLFSSNYPSLNFKNRNYPTTATTQSDNNLKTNRELGFFRPCKTSIVLVDGVNYDFFINVENLLPNSLYYFPDPNIFGENGNVLTFIVDDSNLKKNFSSGSASNQPISNSNDTKYFGYVSKTPPTIDKYLDNIFDSGFVRDIKADVYGNLFGLFKNDHRFRKTIEYNESPIVYNVLFNGYQFYDDMYGESYSFNYTTSDNTTYRETIRSGLSTNTGTFNSKAEISLFFGVFTPYHELISPSETNLQKTYTILENAFISKSDFSLYDESSSSDLSSFEVDSGSFYYTKLVDGGINSYNPLTRGLYDPTYPTISSNFIQYPTISSLNIVDGGWINDNSDFNITIESENYQYINTVDNVSEYTLSMRDYDENFALSGSIFVKNSTYKTTKTLLETFPYFKTRYPQTVVHELSSNVIKFEIANDVIFIQTKSYLTIDKILMIDGIFEDPKTNSMLIQHSDTPFEILSNRFKHGNEVFYSKLLTTNYPISSNDFLVYPEIYKIDLINFKNVKIFPTSQNEITNFFNISGIDVRYVKCSSSTLAYNSKSNMFTISFLLKDQNEMANLHEMDFKITPDVTFTTHNIVNLRTNSYSNILSSMGTLNLILSSSPILFFTEELIL